MSYATEANYLKLAFAPACHKDSSSHITHLRRVEFSCQKGGRLCPYSGPQSQLYHCQSSPKPIQQFKREKVKDKQSGTTEFRIYNISRDSDISSPKPTFSNPFLLDCPYVGPGLSPTM